MAKIGYSPSSSHTTAGSSTACTHLIVFEGDYVAKMYLGNCSDYEMIIQEKFGKSLPRIRSTDTTIDESGAPPDGGQ